MYLVFFFSASTSDRYSAGLAQTTLHSSCRPRAIRCSPQIRLHLLYVDTGQKGLRCDAMEWCFLRSGVVVQRHQKRRPQAGAWTESGTQKTDIQYIRAF